jgi:arabinogalactan endo-1,4-beta-galactosidase
MLHYSLGANADATTWFFDHITAQGIDYDLIGLSYYPWWHGSVAALQATVRHVATAYGKDVLLVETTYPWRTAGSESITAGRPLAWPASAAGQRQFIRDVIAAVAAAPGGRGIGVLWWYPESVPVTGLFVWGGGSMALFDDTGNVLPAARELDAR